MKLGDKRIQVISGPDGNGRYIYFFFWVTDYDINNPEQRDLFERGQLYHSKRILSGSVHPDKITLDPSSYWTAKQLQQLRSIVADNIKKERENERILTNS